MSAWFSIACYSVLSENTSQHTLSTVYFKQNLVFQNYSPDPLTYGEKVVSFYPHLRLLEWCAWLERGVLTAWPFVCGGAIAVGF